MCFRDRFEGQPLKGVALTFRRAQCAGEAIITRRGIEGGAIYALSAESARGDRQGQGDPARGAAPRSRHEGTDRNSSAPKGKQSLSNFLRKAASLSPVGDRSAAGGRQGFRHAAGVAVAAADLAELINAVPIELTGVAPIARAISTAGGVAFDELDADFMVRRLPGVFAAGEMLDWEAPTGGYLLQASFATGAAAGRGALKWLEREKSVGWAKAR